MNNLQRVVLLCAVVFTLTAMAVAQSAGAAPTPQLAKAVTPTPDPAPSPAVSTTPAAAAPAASNAAPAPKPAPKGVPALPPEKSAPVRAVRFDKAPVIDGKLDDDIWKTAAVLRDF